MKRHIVAIALAVLAAPALAQETGEISTAQGVNPTTGSGLATGPWANNYHFIAPAQ